MTHFDSDTICAIATAPGRGGIGIVRISGPHAETISQEITSTTLQPRLATFVEMKSSNGEVIDSGIGLYFESPNSFTGENIVELQGHGGIHVLRSVLARVIECGARLAHPGEFTERAFLNNKIDLLQAEAIADLVDASSTQAARSAMRTLKGVFSAKIHQLVAAITSIRVNVEAAIDFSDEDIDIMTDTGVDGAMLEARDRLAEIFQEAQQGVLLKDGLNIVIAGAPNAGKSSLLNALAGVEAAIVTNIPGTTRDVLRQEISLAGLPMHIYDTAGMRESADVVEQEGVRRARSALGEADFILLVTDAGACDNSDIEQIMQPLVEINTEAGDIPQTVAPQLLNRLCVVFNKVDLLPDQFKPISCSDFHDITLKFFYISAKTGAGLEGLKSHLLEVAGFESTQEQNFSARERHLAALKEADNSLKSAIKGVSDHLQIELIAEDLRMVQQHLGAITGDVTSDDLLGEIFSSFCIGK